jgi:hypothetical protein
MGMRMIQWKMNRDRKSLTSLISPTNPPIERFGPSEEWSSWTFRKENENEKMRMSSDFVTRGRLSTGDFICPLGSRYCSAAGPQRRIMRLESIRRGGGEMTDTEKPSVSGSSATHSTAREGTAGPAGTEEQTNAERTTAALDRFRCPRHRRLCPCHRESFELRPVDCSKSAHLRWRGAVPMPELQAGTTAGAPHTARRSPRLN